MEILRYEKRHQVLNLDVIYSKRLFNPAFDFVVCETYINCQLNLSLSDQREDIKEAQAIFNDPYFLRSRICNVGFIHDFDQMDFHHIIGEIKNQSRQQDKLKSNFESLFNCKTI